MKSKLKRINTLGMTNEQWLRKRQDKIGGSDAATILNQNPFQSSLEAFHSKLGLLGSSDDTWATYAGRLQEDTIIKDYFQYWPYDEPYNIDRFMENASQKNVIRKARKLNAIIQNPDYPIFQVNIDGIINKFEYSEMPDDVFPYHEYVNKEGLMECKWLLGHVVRQYESEIPTYYLFQFMLYLGIMEMEWGELWIVTDGRYPNCYPISFNQELFDGIVQKCQIWWEKVMEAKDMIDSARSENPMISDYQLMQMVQHLEPEPDDSESWKNYLKERYNPDMAKNTVEATKEMIEKGVEYQYILGKEKELKSQKSSIQNFFATEFIHREADTIEFGPNWGSATYKCDKGKEKPTLRISKKVLSAEESL